MELFGDDWEEHFTRQFLAEELRTGSHKSKGVKSMHERITSMLQRLRPPRPTSARQQLFASSSPAPVVGKANSWSRSHAVDGNRYEVLGLSPSERVTADAVREAFIRNAKKWHPDKAAERGVPRHVAEPKWRELVEARDFLCNRITRNNDESKRKTKKGAHQTSVHP